MSDGTVFTYDPGEPDSGVEVPSATYHRAIEIEVLSGTASDAMGVSRVDVRISSGSYDWDGDEWTTSGVPIWREAEGTLNWSYPKAPDVKPIWIDGANITVYSKAIDSALNEETSFGQYSFKVDKATPTSGVTDRT